VPNSKDDNNPSHLHNEVQGLISVISPPQEHVVYSSSPAEAFSEVKILLYFNPQRLIQGRDSNKKQATKE
jgi:hypothetical protein